MSIESIQSFKTFECLKAKAIPLMKECDELTNSEDIKARITNINALADLLLTFKDFAQMDEREKQWYSSGLNAAAERCADLGLDMFNAYPAKELGLIMDQQDALEKAHKAFLAEQKTPAR